MVLRAGEAARMEQNDSTRPKRISNPPRWHRDYLIQSRKPSCPQGQTTSDSVLLEVSQGAAIAETRAEVRDLACDVQQIKGMLSELSQSMRTMQIRSQNSSFSISSNQSSKATSPVVEHNQEDDNSRVSLVQELGECLRQHEANRHYVDPSTSPPQLSRQSTLPPPPRSMLPTPLPQGGGGSLEPSSLQLPEARMLTAPVATQYAHSQFQPSENLPGMSMNPTQFGNVPPWSLIQQPLYPIYPANDSRFIRSGGPVPSQGQGNGFPPWMFPNYPVPVPPPALYPPYGPIVYPSHVFPMAMPSSIQVPSIPPAQFGPSMGPLDVTATSNVPVFRTHTPLGSSGVIQSRDSVVNQPVVTACVHPSSGNSRLAGIERPSFPCFKRNDPQEFAMLNMALKNLLPSEESEQYKYHILLDHLKLDDARHLALAYAHDPQPYTTALHALQRKYGQPHHLVLRELASIQNLPAIRSGDSLGFGQFALRVQALVGMLQSWGQDQGAKELACSSHVHQLLSKLSAHHVSSFARHIRTVNQNVPYNLVDFAKWLEEEAECQSLVVQVSDQSKGATKYQMREERPPKSWYTTATFLQGANQEEHYNPKGKMFQPTNSYSKQLDPGPFCAFCGHQAHHLSQCMKFQQFDAEGKEKWILDNGRCWRCGRTHRSANCDLKKPCPYCKERHLGVLHEVNVRKPDSGIFYLSRPSGLNSVLLKVVKVILSYEGRTVETYAILDDGSERTMLLSPAAEMLGLNGPAESLRLRTIRQGSEEIKGTNVTFSIAPASFSQRKYEISAAFTSKMLDLPEQTYPVRTLQRCYQHLRRIPLEEFHQVKPLLLVGADHPHLLCSTERVTFGPPGSPIALHTRLGWVLQGPTSLIPETDSISQCHFLATSTEDQLQRDVERLWQVDVLPYHQTSKAVFRSKQDQYALECLEQRTECLEMNGVVRYATPLLRAKHAPRLNALQQSVMPALRRTERQIAKNPVRAAIYEEEIQKLVESGYVKKLNPKAMTSTDESWYVPHHLVEHNGKHRLVFDCSYQYNGESLNSYLLSGPTLGFSLLGVLLRFREHQVAISGDIRAMFHQVRLLPSDRPLLRFLWRNMSRNAPVDVYEWQVLPFGTTSSPCCAIYALQRHAKRISTTYPEVQDSVLHSFYVDNCLQSLPTIDDAKEMILKLRSALSEGGFEIRQWSSNYASVVDHLPDEARSLQTDLWLSHDCNDPCELALFTGYFGV